MIKYFFKEIRNHLLIKQRNRARGTIIDKKLYAIQQQVASKDQIPGHEYGISS